MAVINMLKELFQFWQAKLAYFGWTNLFEWATNIMAILLVLDFNFCQLKTGYRHHWQWQLGAVSIFLGWVNLLLFVQKLPQLGIYVVMFTDILKTFSKFFSVFFLFIVAFALAFYTILQQQVGLAVDDIKAVQEQAVLTRKTMQAVRQFGSD
nr:hypothetical protein BaRGS_013768 [Batillaria attramentaria]